MIFLIKYNRTKGQLVELKVYKDVERLEAQDARLKMELDLNKKGINLEVVLLEAATEEILRRTHRRYFENLNQLLQPLYSL
jgi:hypothetical protein